MKESSGGHWSCEIRQRLQCSCTSSRVMLGSRGEDTTLCREATSVLMGMIGCQSGESSFDAPTRNPVAFIALPHGPVQAEIKPYIAAEISHDIRMFLPAQGVSSQRGEQREPSVTA